MTDRRLRFVELYLVSLNATEAYKGAYGVTNDRTAASNGNRLLRNADIAAAIAAKQAERSKRVQVDQDYVVNNLTEVVERCMQRAPVMEFDREKKQYVQSKDADGNDIWTFDAHAVVKALTLLAKHTGGFNDKVDVTLDDRRRAAEELAGLLGLPVDQLPPTAPGITS